MEYETPQDYNKTISELRIFNGYFAFTDKEHPLAYKSNNTVFFHRHQASLKLGRWIKSDEQVHHIDENRLNNNLDNLQILSASDHAKLHNPGVIKVCPQCEKKFNKTKREFCSQRCYCKFNNLKTYNESDKPTKINWPAPEILKEWLWREPTTKIAAQLGVSDKAVDKFCQKHNLEKPPRGYWRKVEVGGVLT